MAGNVEFKLWIWMTLLVLLWSYAPSHHCWRFRQQMKHSTSFLEATSTQRLIRPGRISGARAVPDYIKKPDYVRTGYPKESPSSLPWEITVLTPEEIQGMRRAGRIAREVLDAAVAAVKPGISTDQIDGIVHSETTKRWAYPSPLKYKGFPKSCCTSINEIMCHGIPDDTVLLEGDAINIDVTVYFNGFHGDCAETVLVGNVSKESRELVVTTYEAWRAAIAICKPGVPYNTIGGVIEDYVEAKGVCVARDYCGHGIGRLFHTTPDVFNCRNKARTGIMMPGHAFTIEPIVCMNRRAGDECKTWADGWTVATADGTPSAQFENTILITDSGFEELTGRLPSSPKLSFLT